jgi:hypothetical protein
MALARCLILMGNDGGLMGGSPGEAEIVVETRCLRNHRGHPEC